MAVVENMDGEDGPALVPAPPDLLPLDASKEVFEDTDLSLDASKEVFEDTDLEARGKISNEWFEDTELEAGGQVSNEWFEDTELEAGGQVSNMMNLLRIAIYNISYIRGLFPEQYFRDISVPELEMTIKKLIPKDVESRRLLDWIDEGVNDAMQKKYLETVHFCICEKDEGAPIEDYSFIFNYPNASCEEVAMEFSLDGSEGTSHMFKSNPAESTGNQIRRLIRISAAMMSTLDQLPNERTVLIKLMYHDDVTPEDYEPPLFECCHDDADYTDLIQSFGRLCCISQRAPTLLLDSAATHHIFCDKSYMTKMKKISKDKRIELSAADGAKFKAKKTGSIDIGNIHLSQV